MDLHTVFDSGILTLGVGSFMANKNMLGGVRGYTGYTGGGANHTAIPRPNIPTPTTQPYVPYTPQNYTPQNYKPDARIDELFRRMSGGGGSSSSSLGPLDLSDIDRRGGQLQSLLAQLMRGEGINVGDQSNDPAARAYAVAKQREAERLREAEAARGAVEGGLAGGDADARAAQIRESTGEAIAANNADLTNRRRTEAIATAIQGAGMQMSDLERQANMRRSEYDSKVTGERLRMEGEAGERSNTQNLLNALLSQDQMNRSSFDRQQEINRLSHDKQQETNRVESEARRKEAEKTEKDRVFREQMDRTYGRGRWSY